MLRPVTAPAVVLFLLFVLSAGMDFNRPVFIAPAAAQESPKPDFPVDNLSLGHPFWRRGAGLIYGSMALKHQNDYPQLTFNMSNRQFGRIIDHGIFVRSFVAPFVSG